MDPHKPSNVVLELWLLTSSDWVEIGKEKIDKADLNECHLGGLHNH
jgi:hypothetical protein